jgi:hypothetical protein
MTLNRKIVISIGVLVALLGCGLLFIVWPFRTIRLLEARYQKVQRGMSVEQVQTIMAYTPIRTVTDWFPAWDDEQLSSSEAGRIVFAFQYSVSTYYMPVSFEFTFDSNRQLIGRHIYD